jgi:hypothetical protein
VKARLEINNIEKSYPQDIPDLEKLLLFVMENEISQEEIIIDVKIDGETYSEEYAHQSINVNLHTLNKLEIVTQSKESFAFDFLQQIPGFIAQFKQGFSSAARLLKDYQNEENAYDLLARSLDALGAFKSHLENVFGILEKDYASAGFPGFWDRFVMLTNKILEAQEAMDHIIIAELLESQMLPLLDEWQERLHMLCN